ncbi:NERD domain-containing protein [Fictibacillus sp. KIGAM418]|uniref:NERD domain-containing protein n=1 Tax=Fictibacillus marinisediminis TaxID=2878389 RepID=A0A9X1XCV6_9BACL|nr:nuclease-related domain-containing protein [Fictibacillus marinisediminis]MCK6258497.1 NERD domain-containing protein [Fictibacillus marinisediminis]
MIVKTRNRPLYIQKLQALLRRLPKNHSKIPFIQETLAKHTAGYRGEHSIDYPLSFLSPQNYYIVHDLRLPHNEYHFQIDTLLISPYYLFILEVKNIAGTLFFDQDFHQLIRTLDDKVEVFPDPILQVKRHKVQLTSWLNKHKLPDIPIETLVVISHPNSQIQTSPPHQQYVRRKVIHRNALPFKINQIEGRYNEAILSIKQLKKITRLLLKQHNSSDSSVMEQFNIHSKDIIKGVHCPECFQIPMERVHGTWLCAQCLHTCKTAHIEALRDYSYLIQSTISNREARDFLKINSNPLASRILQSISTETEGNQRGRTYHLTFED